MRRGWKSILLTMFWAVAGCMLFVDTAFAASADGYTYEVLSDGTAKLVSYDGNTDPAKIPETIDGYTVTVIGERCYFDSPLVDNTIPTSVTEIEDFAFGYAEDKDIVLPSTVKKCGKSIFFNSKIESVTLEEGWTEITENMFSGCEELTTVNLPESLLYIRDSAFTHGGTINELVLPAGLKEIEGYAFYTTEIKKLVANCKNVVIGDESLWECYVGELHCYYNSTIYKEFKNANGVKIVFIGNPLFFEKSKVTVGVGAQTTLKVYGTGKVTWKSSNKKVATVSQKGVVTAKKKGNVRITASRNGETVTCKVQVKNNERKLESYSTKASSYASNQALLGFKKIKRDSKGNYILSGHLINTYAASTSYAKNLQIKVYRNNKLIAKQTYKTWKIKVGARSSKAITLKINKKNIKKKKTDLTSGTIRVEIAGGKIY